MTASLKEHRMFHCRAIAFAALLAIGAVPVPAAAEPVTLSDGSLGLREWTAGDAQAYLHAWYPAPDPIQFARIEVQTLFHEENPNGGTAEIEWPVLPDAIEAGAVANVSARMVWTGGGLLQYWERDAPDCCVWPPADGGGTFEVTGGNAVLALDVDGFLVGRAPFVFSGRFDVLDRETGLSLFQREVQGRGTAAVTLSTTTALTHPYRSYVYHFASIPEPSMMVLLGLGAAGIAARRGRTRLSGR